MSDIKDRTRRYFAIRRFGRVVRRSVPSLRKLQRIVFGYSSAVPRRMRGLIENDDAMTSLKLIDRAMWGTG
jgi:hypothetical protein